jgi:phospholipid-translocating ATPase
MSFFRRHPHLDDGDTDEELHENIDPDLRLRTVRTAASAIAESILSEARAQKRKSLRKKGSFFRPKGRRPKTTESTVSTSEGARLEVKGERRNIYVNHGLTAMEVDHHGEPVARYVRNKVKTSSELYRIDRYAILFDMFIEYTPLTFVPKNLYEQFRRCVLIYSLNGPNAHTSTIQSRELVLSGTSHLPR